MSSRGIKSSVDNDRCDSIISERRASPYWFRTASSSSRITAVSLVESARIASRSAISSRIEPYSSSNFSISRPVSRCSRKSKIAWACWGLKWYWPSTKPNPSGRSSGRIPPVPARSSMSVTDPGAQDVAINRSFATCALADDLINSITGSIFAKATAWPSKMWPRSRAFRSSNKVLRVTTSRRWRIKQASMSLRFKVFGWPSTKATMLIPKLDCNCVWLNRLLTMTSGVSPRRRSITIRIPSLSDSSRSSVIPSIFFSFTNSAIFSMTRALLTW